MKKIFRESNISEAVKKYKSKVQTAVPKNKSTKKKKSKTKTAIDETALENLFKNGLSQYKQQKNKIIQIVKSEKSRTAINNSIGKYFHNGDQKNIMGSLKPIIENLPGK